MLALSATACGNSPEQTDNAAVEAGEDSEKYAATRPDVTVNLSIFGTGGGFERFCTVGDTHISSASRPIKDEEASGEPGLPG